MINTDQSSDEAIIDMDNPPLENATMKSLLIPGEPHFLMSYSTLPGSRSHRHKERGAFYIKALCNQLKRNIEIDRALKAVTQEVRDRLAHYKLKENVQFPFHLTTGMSKLIYLCEQ